MLKEAFGELEQALVEVARRHYGTCLVSLVIYGSAGRGTQRPDSDLDVLVVAEDLPAGRLSRARDFERVELDLVPVLDRHQHRGLRIELSPVLKTRQEVLAGSPLLLDMVEDALILYDKEGFFRTVLAKLQDRLAALGARRVWRGGVWYWDLKPDFRPGEVFEI